MRALQRGVAVRVLIDGVGAHYSRPTMVHCLRSAGVPVAAFLPTHFSRALPYANLRNHRKLLVADGVMGFAGGLNIREGHWLAMAPSAPVSGLHFRLEGPVVADLQNAFAVDWAFTTGERLAREPWFAPAVPVGSVCARGVPGGPDEDLNHTADMLLGAISQAAKRVRIVTPYFLPDETLRRVLEVAALRGVEIDIVVPCASNLPFVDWARLPQLAYLAAAGCRVHLTPPPFDH